MDCIVHGVAKSLKRLSDFHCLPRAKMYGLLFWWRGVLQKNKS